MELNTSTFPVFVQLAPVIFEMGMDDVPALARTSGLFKVENMPANTGNTRQFTEIDLEEFADDKGESDQATRARVVRGYSKTLTSYRVAKDIGISYEMRTQGKYQDIITKLTNLSQMAAKRMELDLTHRITFGTATSYTNRSGAVIDTTVGDTKALFATDHTLSGSATTYRNRLANNPRISRGALEAMEQQAIENTYNHFGEKKTMTYDILWTTDDRNTINTVKEHLNSTASPEATHAGVTNPYRGQYRHVVLPYIATTAAGANDTTKRYYWGIASSMHSTAHLGVWEEPHLKVPSSLNAGEEFSTDDWNFGVRSGYGICVVTANWIQFSSGDGTA